MAAAVTRDMIDDALARIPFRAGDTVKAGSKVGTVIYVYYNGFLLIEFPGQEIQGGILNNNSTYPVSQVAYAK